MIRPGRPAPGAVDVLRLELGTDPVSADLLSGIETVFHCAGIAHQAASDEEYRRVNHDATLDLAAAAWKRQTEQALAAGYAASPMAVSSVRPALVYGPGVRGNLRTLITGVRCHMPPPPVSGGRSLIGLNDLVTVLCLLGETGRTGYSCFEVTDGEVYSSRRIYAAIRAGLGKSPGWAWLPGAGWRLGCALLDMLGADASKGSYQKLFGEELYSNTAICAALDWQPRFTLEQQVRDMLEGNT
jgi:nucleoside-diphosphate-sugar epimerase